METYRVSKDTVRDFTSAFNQNGKGLDIDRYIYTQQGAGIGSFFGKLLRFVLPAAKTAINTAVAVAKPHLQAIGTQLVKEGTRVATNKLGELGENTIKRINKRKLDNLSHNE